jgi:hypothetical protein
MNTLDTRATRAARRVTQTTPPTTRRCPRCHHTGTFTPDSIVCDRCADTRPLIFTVTVTVTLTVIGGGR